MPGVTAAGDGGLDRVLGPLEADVLRAIWAAGHPVSVRELMDRLNANRREPLAYTTVMTVMARLADKDVLRRRQQGRAYVYEAAVEDAAGIAVRNVVRDFGDAAVAHLAEQARGDAALRARLRRLLDDQER
jgi:predicted transcriptional regulator